MTGQMILPSNVRVLYQSQIASNPLVRAEHPQTVGAQSIRAQVGWDLVRTVRRWFAVAPRPAD